MDITEVQVNDFIYLLFAAEIEQAGKPLKREEIIKNILPGSPRQFDELFRKTKSFLATEYGMDIKELPVLPPPDIPGLNSKQKHALQEDSALKSTCHSYLYILLDNRLAYNPSRISLVEEGGESPESDENNDRLLGLLFSTLSLIHLRNKAIPLEELVALFKQYFGPIPEYESLVRETWRRQRYLRFIYIPKSNEIAETIFSTLSENGPIVTWGPRAVLEFPLTEISRLLSENLSEKQQLIIKAFS